MKYLTKQLKNEAAERRAKSQKHCCSGTDESQEEAQSLKGSMMTRLIDDEDGTIKAKLQRI